MHSALLPNPSAVQAIASRLDPVFEDNALQFLGHSFFGLSMSASIRHEQAREEVTAAEQAILARDYGSALGYLRVAFDVVCGEYVGFGEQRLFSRRIEDHSPEGDSWVRHDIIDANRAWDRVVRRLNLLESGIDLADHARFLAITPTVLIPGNHRKRVIYRRADEALVATAENTAFALTFVIESLNQLESRVRSPSARSFYRLRAKTQTVCVEMTPDGSLLKVQTLAPGDEVVDARFSLGPQGSMGNCWTWQNDAQRILAPFDAFEIIEETSERDYHERKRRSGPGP
jgi:hypothetical protein